MSIIVAYAPGDSTDTLARTIGQKLSDKIGQSVIIDNRPGATGQLGSRYVTAAARTATRFKL